VRDKLQREAQRTREFVATTAPKRNAKGVELKSNATDIDSAKMATSKSVIQGYSAQAAVDSKYQVIVAADVIGSSSEKIALLPMMKEPKRFARLTPCLPTIRATIARRIWKRYASKVFPR
jgi:hypothetical protein